MATALEPKHPQRRPSPPAIRVLDTALVHPSLPSPPETSVPLTFFDIFWLRAPPVQRILFYRLAPDADVDAVLSGLRESLSQALRAFFPLAGRLRLAPGTANRYELYYRPGDAAVAFAVAVYDDHDLDSLASDEPREVSKLAPLVPPLPEDGDAVLAVQATLLPSRGLALGVTVHHAACDGAASTHFLHTWAAANGSQPPPPAPVIDRTLVSDPRGLYDAFCPTADTNDKFFNTPANDQVFATFVLSRAHLQRVKVLVAAEAAARGVAPPQRCSSLVATLGLVWSCHQRATKPSARGDGDEGRACLMFPVDHRSRTTPPLPDRYFGNCVGPAVALASTAELAAGGGLFSACAAAAVAIEEAVTDFDMLTAGKRAGAALAAATSSMLSVAGSPRFRVYDLDFGFGRPAKVDVVSVAATGAIAVAEGRDGDGSVGGTEVGVCLPPDGMAAFRKCFADAVAGLDAGTR